MHIINVDTVEEIKDSSMSYELSLDDSDYEHFTRIRKKMGIKVAFMKFKDKATIMDFSYEPESAMVKSAKVIAEYDDDNNEDDEEEDGFDEDDNVFDDFSDNYNSDDSDFI